MSKDSIYEQLKDLLTKSGGTYRIMEEQIDVDLQVEFFELANKLLNKKRDTMAIMDEKERLFNSETSVEDKKRILVELSNTEEPDAYRIIQRFINEGDKELKPWAILSLQHSRITLETHLLGEQQVFISTGLGGDSFRLRYFIAIKTKYGKVLNEYQKKIIGSEFETIYKKYNSLIEDLQFFERYFTIICLIPIDITLSDIIPDSITEANQYGNFLNKDYLVTNVKKLSNDEIENYFNKKKK